MQSQQLESMRSRLEYGYQLTTDEQRWLWNTCVALTTGEFTASAGILQDLGGVSAVYKCAECNGTGTWGESLEWSLTHPLSCLACAGTGNQQGVEGEAVVYDS